MSAPTTLPMRVGFARVRPADARGPALPAPAYGSAGASGLDLTADVTEHLAVRLEPGARARVPTGVAVALPEGFEGQVRPRSGAAYVSGLTVLNAPGTVDADYRGEIEVLLVNLGDRALFVKRGDRIAQLVVAPVARVELEPAERLETTARGAGGFGSTGGAPAAAPPPPAAGAQPPAGLPPDEDAAELLRVLGELSAGAGLVGQLARRLVASRLEVARLRGVAAGLGADLAA